MPTDQDLIPTSEAAQLAGVSVKTFIRWSKITPPKIEPAQKLPGVRGAYLFNRADVEALLAPTERAS